MKEIIGVESDDDDCQVISEIRPTNETVNAQLPNTTTTTTTTSSQNVPVLTTNAGVWNNVLPNMNFSMLGVNQMLASNLIDPSLFVGQTVNDEFTLVFKKKKKMKLILTNRILISVQRIWKRSPSVTK